MTALLEARGLSKLYPVGSGRKRGLLHAVDGVDLVIGQGESVGLVGESGCGKSTLSRLVARLIEPTAGSIRLAGEDIAGISTRRFVGHAARARIQMVFQDPTESLNPHFKVAEAVADPLRRLKGMAGAPLRDAVARALDLVGLPAELAGRYPHQLSGGQRARVGIARAIALEPMLLILDEPTSALDVSVQAVVLRLLAELRQRLALSFLFVSHDLAVVRLMCERVAVMYLGKIVETAPAATLMTAPAHPYTQALIAAVPDPARRGRSGPRLDGSPGSPVDPDPNACRFLARCPRAFERCGRAAPSLEALEPDHEVACHLAAHGQVAPPTTHRSQEADHERFARTA